MKLSESDIQERVANELAFKLRLEKPLAVKFRQLFRTIGKDLAAVYEATGSSLNASEYYQEVLGLLKPVYRKAAREVSTVLRDNIKSSIGPVETKQDAEIDNAIRSFVNTAPEDRAKAITDTTQKNIDAAILGAITAMAISGDEPTKEAIATQAGKDFTDSNLFRGDMIAETEVLNAVEGSKFVELDTILALGLVVGGIVIRDKVKREWVTVLDDKTRSAHARADGQRVDGTNAAFDVGGDRLRFPGDTSLGASVGNIINCRCGAHTMLSEDQPVAEQVAF